MYDLTYRPRRLRINPEMRDLVRETTLDVTDLIYPLFIVPGEGIKKEIDTLPGQYPLSVDEAVKAAIRQWEFTPAIGTDQKAHASIIGMTITLPKGNAPAKSGNGKLTVDKSQSNDNHASDVNAKANGPKAK